MIHRVFLIVLIVFCFELGIFLLVLPWSSFWERNYFLYQYPELTRWLLNHYLRGAVSGLGVIDLYLAIYQTLHFRETLASLESH